MRRWNDDPYTKKARQENYEARSVYKLEEIDQREKLFAGVKRVLDLGASPGSWCQYCLKKLPKDGQLFAVDLAPIKVTDPRLNFRQENWNNIQFGEWLAGPIDLVLSDMAPKTSGIHDRDVALSLELVEGALNVAQATLRKGGGFVTKLFMGEGFEQFHQELKLHFGTVKLLRPETTRKHSREIYFIGKDFRKD